MKEEIYEAVKYANSSNKLETNCLSDNEFETIVQDILVGKTDDSFLHSVVESVKEANKEVGAEKLNVKIRK